MFSYVKKITFMSVAIHSLAFANMAPNGFSQFVRNYFIETGTHTGRGIEQALTAGFKIVHSIELNSFFASSATQKFKNYNNVHIWQGDSGSILYSVIKDINEPVTFWLDGHNGVYNPRGENTPLLRELEEIKRHHIKTHTILIDDMHCAGGPLFDFITQVSIIAKIKEINSNYVISYVAGGDDGEYPNNVMVAQVPTHRSAYLDSKITDLIDKKEVNLIVEIGAFDCQDAIQLYQYYGCPVISFECAPESIKKARVSIQDYPFIKLVEKAVWDSTKKIDFYYCTEHPSASSCYFFDYQIMADRDRETMHQMVKKYPIKSIKVDAICLDEWLKQNEINEIDLICINTQGATLPILKGLKAHLNKVKYIVTQVMYQRIYREEALFPEINSFMKEHGYTVFNQAPDGFFNNVVFVRNDLITQ